MAPLIAVGVFAGAVVLASFVLIVVELRERLVDLHAAAIEIVAENRQLRGVVAMQDAELEQWKRMVIAREHGWPLPDVWGTRI